MIKIKEIQANCIYLFSGKASANSIFIESLDEAHEFINSANSRFKNYMKIREYLVTESGWSFICEIESEELILATYLQSRLNRGREYKNPPFEDVWRIMSEQVRHWLSRFIKNCNFSQGRTGGKVHSNYERHLFASVNEAEEYIVAMHAQDLDFGQKKRQYRGNRQYFRVSPKRAKEHVYLCSKNLVAVLKWVFDEVGAMWNEMLCLDILRKIVKSTLQTHLHSNSTFQYPQKE